MCVRVGAHACASGLCGVILIPLGLGFLIHNMEIIIVYSNVIVYVKALVHSR